MGDCFLLTVTLALLAQCMVEGIVCRHRFTKLNNGCYFFDGVRLSTWSEAQKHCLSLGANLVSVESRSENEALISHMKQYNGAFRKMDFWTSGNDIEQQGKYLWASTLKSVGPFTAWARGEPSGPPQHCLQYHNFEWDDQSCDVKNSFICEEQHDKAVLIG